MSAIRRKRVVSNDDDRWRRVLDVPEGNEQPTVGISRSILEGRTGNGMLHEGGPGDTRGDSPDRDHVSVVALVECALVELTHEAMGAVFVSQQVRQSTHTQYVAVDDEPGPESDRAYIERNAITLVSNYRSDPLDMRAGDWLGLHSPVPVIRRSGLWNINDVDEEYDPNFLYTFEEQIAKTAPV